MSTSKLFEPIQVGDVTLAHRVVLAPLTRCRADAQAVICADLAAEYYAQRGSAPGTLLISEGTLITAKAGGWAFCPGIWNDAQAAAWKKVADAVHARGSYIYMQLYAMGRGARPTVLEEQGFKLEDVFVAPSPIPLKDRPEPIPREMTVADINEYVQAFATAAGNAVHKAGFDGVEVDCANGFLLDQFLQDMTNHRTDQYGGSVENRVRFPLEVIKAVTDLIGAHKTGIRISPWSTYQDMRMDDARPTFMCFLSRLRDDHPGIAYIHIVEPGIAGNNSVQRVSGDDSNDFVREIWQPKPIISAGGYSRETALEAADKHGYLIAFGRLFIANPDLPYRIKEGAPYNPPDRATFYTHGAEGYVDYPFASDIPDIISAA
ncbi:FMN-linked oxidoreductase [Gloeophyllum trabeum ATCC 11539]|uniref:FMN-linked oxidoreductase n=1 Tax=Gloeophyllum trabeum (strain ATCC 11539 / FP-39264 / Madison 617) TaxID=670483 RepID=S7RAQ0_GLOTA|nr:FMN-linked oxidoreductase [Gloeophyllum trabeum ATCC 11539]EPQ51340.1 FMN-linked oxidoreductase [Gloeophyllum trabeum ATCC 11539]